MVGRAVETMVASRADRAMAHISAATSSVLRSCTRAVASEFVWFTLGVYVRVRVTSRLPHPHPSPGDLARELSASGAVRRLGTSSPPTPLQRLERGAQRFQRCPQARNIW